MAETPEGTPLEPVFAGVPGRSARARSMKVRDGESWEKGAVGEEKFAAALAAMNDDRLLVLHDRARPRSRANIDHIVIAPTGVWVIDPKRYAGRVAAVDKGGWFRTDVRLKVGGRDRTKLVEGVRRQVALVEEAVGGAAPVHGALCFVDAEWGFFARPFRIDGVLVAWRKAIRKRLAAAGPLDGAARATLHRHLADAFPPAR